MTHGDCIEYEGARNANGYGVLPPSAVVDGSRLAHRAALTKKLGRKLQGFALHTCDNPACINPHLWEGTQAENMADAAAKGRARGHYSYKTHCINGHEFSGDNVRMVPNPRVRSGFERVCIECRRAINRKYAAKRKAQRANARRARQIQEQIYG